MKILVEKPVQGWRDIGPTVLHRGGGQGEQVKKKLHMIGNAHLDPVWLWQWQEVKSTFRSALDRMEE